MVKTHLESSRSLLRCNETVGVVNLAVRGIPQGEYKSKKDKHKYIGVTGQSKVKHRYFRRPCFSSKEEKNKSTCIFFHFCRQHNGINIQKSQGFGQDTGMRWICASTETTRISDSGNINILEQCHRTANNSDNSRGHV